MHEPYIPRKDTQNHLHRHLSSPSSSWYDSWFRDQEANCYYLSLDSETRSQIHSIGTTQNCTYLQIVVTKEEITF